MLPLNLAKTAKHTSFKLVGKHECPPVVCSEQLDGKEFLLKEKETQIN